MMKFFKGNVYNKEHFNYVTLIFWIKNYFFLLNTKTEKKIKIIKKILKFDIFNPLFLKKYSRK